jgi:hypothetical protein
LIAVFLRRHKNTVMRTTRKTRKAPPPTAIPIIAPVDKLDDDPLAAAGLEEASGEVEGEDVGDASVVTTV